MNPFFRREGRFSGLKPDIRTKIALKCFPQRLILFQSGRGKNIFKKVLPKNVILWYNISKFESGEK